MVETVEQVRELPIVGGQLALDFANTVDDPEGPARHDHIADYPGLLRWSRRIGLLSPAQVRTLAKDPAAPEVLRRAHELRDLLNGIFGAVAAGRRPTNAQWQALRPLLAQAVAAADLKSGAEAYAYSWSGAEAEVMLWPVVQAAGDLLRSPELARVKQCGNCPWLFLDRSKNGSRRWCSMEDCGTHAKIRRYVERRAARREAADGRKSPGGHVKIGSATPTTGRQGRSSTEEFT